MRSLFLFAVSTIAFAALAQTEHFVEVGGSTLGPLLPYYSPNIVTIEVGDMVTWTNESGTHNVDGRLDFYPANPEGFTNGDPSNDDWTYSYTFTIPGVYNYMCGSEGHSATQTGRVFVLEPNSVPENRPAAAIVLSPVPAKDHLLVETGDLQVARFDVIGSDGRTLLTFQAGTGKQTRLDVGTLAAGTYLLRITEAPERTTVRRFSKQ
ncbi:MAG: T9SS type A sorting domain-containing protein [Flavobacteriales bacterium]|nr:T9SS type A sorting domain-containing protein [Flavobacteriales bacterium]MCB9178237.1 T9SS type A sorting domain-containing protein [Flavobacteriales bacterium]HPF89617.1 T9SS type A sorting domain-containing protein [Flavobacteriales bacterium]